MMCLQASRPSECVANYKTLLEGEAIEFKNRVAIQPPQKVII